MTTQTATPSVPGGPVFENEFGIGYVTAGTPSDPVATVLDNGNVVTVWAVSSSSDGANSAKLYAQVHDQQGRTVGNGAVEIASVNGVSELKPAITALDGASYVVAYNTAMLDWDTLEISERIAYRVVDNGQVGAESFVESHGVAQGDHAITSLEYGDFVIGWTEHGNIMTQTFSGNTQSSGLPAGEPWAPASSLGHAGAATSLSMTGLADNKFAVAYADVKTSQIFLAVSDNLHPIGGAGTGFEEEVPVANGVVFTQVWNDGAKRPVGSGSPETAVATLADGRVVVTWDSWQNHSYSATGSDIVYRIFDTHTSQFELWTARYASEGGSANQVNATVTALSGGGFVLAWENGGEGEAAEVMGRRFDSTGEDASYTNYAIFQVNQDSAGAQTSPALVAFDDNTFGAVWVDTPASGPGAHIEGRVSIVPPLAAPDLASHSDNGNSSEDNVTSHYQLTFTGKVAPENEASSVTVFVDMNHNGQLDSTDLSQTVSSWGGKYSADIYTPRNIEGSFDVYAVATNEAGKSGALSEALRVTIDTLAPTNTVLDVWFGDRNSPAKMVTNGNQVILHGELSQALREGETVQYYMNGWQDLPVLPGQKIWDAPVSLDYHSNELQLRIVDAAQNVGSNFRTSYQVDSQGPHAYLVSDPFPQMPTDNEFVIDINYEEYQSGFAANTFSPENITVTFGNTVLEVISAQPRGPLHGPGQVVSYTVRAPGGAWDGTDAGQYLVSFNAETVRDGLGNKLDASPFYMYMSARPVVTPSAPFLGAPSDTGVDPHDSVTNAGSLTLTGGSDDVDGAPVSAFIDVDGNGSFDAQIDRAGNGMVQNGTWLVEGIDASGLEGSYNMYAFNPNDTMGATSEPGYVVIDRTAPGHNMSVKLGDDTGASWSDLVTRWQDQYVSGMLSAPLGDGDIVEVMYDANIGWVQADAGYWASEWSMHGVHLNQSGVMQVRVTDRAGNAGEITYHSYLLDKQAGQAQIQVQDLSVTNEYSEHSFTVVYTDIGGAGIDLATIGLHNVQVQNHHFWMPVVKAEISGAQSTGKYGMEWSSLSGHDFLHTGPQQITVTYTVQAPGASWDAAEAGQYSVYVTPSVLDRAGNPVWGSAPATFNVTLPAPHVNAAPTGNVTIAGTIKQGETLTAGNDLVDVDGIAAGSIGYQWQADGVAIEGATGGTLVLGQDQVGKAISVVAKYFDQQGTAESKASVATAVVENVNDAPIGSVTITGIAKQGETLGASAHLADADGIAAGSIGYQWQANGADIKGATGATLVLGQDQVGKAISVVAKYFDQQGTAESKASVATTVVENVNDAPTGSVTITGTASEGEILTAGNTLADTDGIANGSITYQWQAGGVDIVGATGSTFALTTDQVGKTISVVAKYLDQQGTHESQASVATAAVTNVNAAPVGKVTIAGIVKQGETLTASNDLVDADGIVAGSIGYQWQADGVAIEGATGGTLVLGQDQVGKAISVVAKYLDQQGTSESKASVATAVVENVNDAPTGSVTITGIAKQGGTLAASAHLADADGIAAGSIGYQWQANGADIKGATGGTLVLGQDQVGKAISVVAKYFDQQGTAESKASVATSVVENVNDAPTGSVTITGTASEGEILTAGNTLADTDGIANGSITYQWQAGGVDIIGATGSTFVLTADQVGKTISVVAKYLDQQGTHESQASVATAAVTNVNAAPVGKVTIAGIVKQGETLTAGNDLVDVDGIAAGSIGYQWQADGVAIEGATGSTLVLGQDQVGKAISVVATYLDQQGTSESKASVATAVVENVNDAPTGSVTITGIAMQGQTLTAGNDFVDADGIVPGSIGYQWQANGADIKGATGATLVLGQDQVGKTISVLARYIDAKGVQEKLGAALSNSVVDVNDKPTLSVTTTTAAEYVAGNATGVALFSNVALSTVETGQAISEVVLRVSGLKDAADETLTIGGKQLSLVAGNPVTLEPGKTATLKLDDGALHLSIKNTAGWSVADAKALIEGMQYKNLATTPTLTEVRVFEITSVKDNGGTGHGGVDTAFVGFSSKATVVAAPVMPEKPASTGNSSTIDGVTVEASQVANPDGTTSQTLTIPVVTPGRVEQTGNDKLADIPLVSSSNGAALLTAQVPTGVGLTIIGSNEAKTVGNSVTDLIREIKAHTVAGSFDQNQLTGGGTGFLSELPSSTTLLVQTIVPTVAANAVAGSEALVINGTLAASGKPMTALVIDAQALPAGTNIELNNVEFAAVIGNVRVTGGNGSQHVWGDGGSQHIMLGADDDVLHGGAGNDRVGSAGGDDRVFGDEGDDVVFGGAGNDYVDGGTGHDVALLVGAGRADYSFRVVDGNLTVKHLGNGTDGIDTIANVETLRFEAAASDLSIRGTVNRLYEAVGQDADFAATERWIDAYKNGTKVGDIANAMLGLNAAQKAMSNADFVADLYQNVLHRTADASGQAFWVDALQTGKASRASVALGFAESSEKLAMAQSLDIDINTTEVATLVRMYNALLDRTADEDGLNSWIAQYESGSTLSSIADSFITSSENIARGNLSSNADFVNALYRTAFDREGDAAGLDFWTNALNSGMADKGDVLLAFADSAEMIELIGVVGTSIDTL